MTPKSTKQKPRLHLVRGDLDRESRYELARILDITKRDLESYFKHGRTCGRYKLPNGYTVTIDIREPRKVTA